MFVIQQWPDDVAAEATRNLNLPDDPVSDYVTVETIGGKQEGMFMVSLYVREENDVHIIRYSAANGWNPQELVTEVSSGIATAQTDQDGVFVASKSRQTPPTHSPETKDSYPL